MAACRVLLVDQGLSRSREWGPVLETKGHGLTRVAGLPEVTELARESYDLVVVHAPSAGEALSPFLVALAGEEEAPDVVVVMDTPDAARAVAWMKCGARDCLMAPVTSEQIGLLADGRAAASASGRGRVAGKTQIVTCNPRMEALLSMLDRVADSSASVLITGESGTGKELIARYVHGKSSRSKGPFVAVNCAALPESLMESELFGHEKGAFTGAIGRKAGKFELAEGGTLLLDEITEMPVTLQAKLLRAIQEKEVDRLGGTAPVSVNVRVVATTNRDLKEAIETREFREDLYFRLNVIPVKIPPLRERKEDIEALARHFMARFSALDGRIVKNLTEDAVGRLQNYPFAGNVRELENLIHRAVLLADGETIGAEALWFEEGEMPLPTPATQAEISHDFKGAPLREVERIVIFDTLEQTGGNRTHAAKILGISVRTLRNKLNEYRADGSEIP
ncbi:sigma-54-dependent Fis family transcriptional regulator [Desulfoluna limicola]|uniref:Sigma-54-dependent Fis family transcriptional regulator n=1 Tax=Desulfoluna limicola TaxID=2810562 RepID=A0ABM7PLM5_9BACT|nr:sigma-54 dependent transcriptional regulator [Desulfoluna limicola]BCS98428.1 sigma-54-dependent Fis family transcriptional regulator [Desulfoluna limicola]